MKTAIVFYSMSGNTKYVAGKVAAAAGADLIEIAPEKKFPAKGLRKLLVGGRSAVTGATPALLPYEFKGSEYDRVVIATPVWAGSPAPPLNTFIRDNREGLKDKKIALILCFKGGGADKATAKVKELTGCGEFEAELVLVDPKKNAGYDVDKQIAGFVKKITE